MNDLNVKNQRKRYKTLLYQYYYYENVKKYKMLEKLFYLSFNRTLGPSYRNFKISNTH